MGISVSTGLSSGIDYAVMITQLMAVESQPLELMTKKATSYQSKITGLGTLKSSLSKFQTAMKSLSGASKYQTLKATVADTSIATVGASSIAKAGTYSLEVTQLAQAQKLVATGQTSASAAIGSGTITFDFGKISGGTLADGKYTDASFTSSGSGEKTINIDSSNNSLTGIRDAINSAEIGVTATIVNDGSDKPFRLALTVDDTGEESSIKISVGGDAALGDLLNYNPTGTQKLEQTTAAQNAKFTVNGIAISKASNTAGDVISGVTLSLLKTNKDSATQITVARDTSSISTSIESFVSTYNELTTAMQELSAYNKDTKETGLLNGDSSVRTVQAQVRRVLATAVPGGSGSLTMLSQIGVSFNKDGTLGVDSAKLQTALTNNFDSFAGLFATSGRATDGLVGYIGASSSTKPGSYSVDITQVATQGNAVASAALTLPTTITGSNKTLTLKIDGTTATITLDEGEYTTAAQLAAHIQSKINGASDFSSDGISATASVSDEGMLSITSSSYGSKSIVSITGGSARSILGLDSSTSTAGVDVAGTINGLAATGSGQILTAASGDADGIILEITGGSTGPRGSVSYSQGYANQFDTLLTKILGEDGTIATHIDSLNKSIEDINDQKEKATERLADIEKRYRSQFTALEKMLSTMNSTSTYLTQQLDALANLDSQ